MATNYNPGIVTNELTFCLDAANPKSYPGTGSTWYDISGLGQHATLESSPTFDSSGYFTFNGSNQGAYATRNAASWNGSTYTLIAIAHKTSSTATRGIIFNSCVNYIEGSNGGNTMASFYSSSNAQNTIYGNTAAYNEWRHYAITYDGSYQKLYENNYLTASSSALSAPVNTTRNNTIYVAQFEANYRFAGRIAYVAMYNRALNPEEISQNFNALRGRFGI